MKTALKAIARSLAIMMVAVPWLLYLAGALVLGRTVAFAGWSQAFSLLPGLSGIYLRRAFYLLVLPQCEADVCITFGTLISHPTAQLGRHVYVGAFCTLGDVVLEEDVLIGSHVSIANGRRQHGIDRLDVPVREQSGLWPQIRIGRDTWVGDRAVVLADVGRHCVIGAGAVVTEPIPDFAIAVGVPAKVVRYRGQPAPDGSTSEIIFNACAALPE